MASAERSSLRRARVASSQSPVLVVAVAAEREPRDQSMAEVLPRVESRLRHLICLGETELPLPRFRCVSRAAPPAGEDLLRARRLVVVARVPSLGAAGRITCWHHELHRPGDSGPLGETRAALSLLRLSGAEHPANLHHLPLWLEDEIPPEGVDFIGVGLDSAAECGRPSRHRQLAVAVAGVTGALWRILQQADEEDHQRRAA